MPAPISLCGRRAPPLQLPQSSSEIGTDAQFVASGEMARDQKPICAFSEAGGWQQSRCRSAGQVEFDP